MRRLTARPPDVLMVLENCGYPLDTRVRMEAETLRDSGHAVEVIAPREAGEARRERVAGIAVRRVRIPDGGGSLARTMVEYLLALPLVSAAVLPRLMRSRRGTLHVHNPPDFFFPLLLLARLRGWSTVFDHHDDAAGMMREKLGRDNRAASALAWMRNRSARAADVTITTNETQSALVRPHAREVVVVRNSPPVWFAEQRPSPPRGRVRLVFLGEIGAQDRVERAVEVLAELLQGHGLDAELLVIGDGPQRAEVERRAADLGVSERVLFSGWVPFEQVPVLLATAHVGLDTAPPSEVNNGSTMVKVLEYLVVGLPVVASDLRETRVTGGDAIVTVAEDSASAFVTPLLELLGSTDSWQRSADRARERGAALLWPAQAERLLAAYRRLGAGPGSR